MPQIIQLMGSTQKKAPGNCVSFPALSCLVVQNKELVTAALFRQPLYIVDQSVCLTYQRFLFAVADVLAAELRIGKALNHLGGKKVAERRDGLQAVLETIVGCVVSGQSSRGNFQAGQAKFTHRSIDAFVGPCELNEIIAALLHALRQGPLVQIFGEHAALVLIVVFQPYQAEQRGTNIRMVGPSGAIDSGSVHSRTNHAKPGRGAVLLKVTVVPGEAGLFGYAG